MPSHLSSRRPTRAPRRARAEGFTLIELLVAMGILSVMLALSAGALRTYWLTQSLAGSRDEVVAELRQIQERSVAESLPLVYGVGFTEGRTTRVEVVFNPGPTAGTGDDSCAPATGSLSASTIQFQSGTRVSAASFATAPDITSLCDAAINPSTQDDLVFFFSRGSATGGSVTLAHPSLPGKAWTVTVGSITGRVDTTP